MAAVGIDDLVERLEKAGPDETASLIREAAMLLLPTGEPFSAEMVAWTRIEALIVAEAYTDAALALMEAALPTVFCYEMGWQASALAEVAYQADLHFSVGYPPTILSERGEAPTQQNALLLATLRALSAKETGNG